MGLIIGGLLVGIVLGVPPALRTKMTAMPQLVALFNGVGTVARSRSSREGRVLNSDGFTTVETVPSVCVHRRSLFAAIIVFGLVWGSLVAFAKLQELFNKNFEKKVVASAKAFQLANMILAVVSVGHRDLHRIQADPDQRSRRPRCGSSACSSPPASWVCSSCCPIGGADMPSYLAAQRAHRSVGRGRGSRAQQPGDDRRRHDRGASGSILTNLMPRP